MLLANEQFASKAAVQRRAKELLRTVPVGTSLAGQDLAFVLALLALHPRSAEKVGAGISRVLIQAGMHRRPGFWLQRTDGTATDFSYMKCLGIKNSRSDILKAFRFCVVDQVLRVREEQLAGRTEFFCPVDQVVVPASDAQVDHAPPNTFQVLLEQFLLVEELQLSDVQVSGSGDGSMDKWLTDKELAQRWDAFHYQYAKLRLISSAANQRLK